MNSPVSLKLRSLAVVIHFIGGIPALMAVITTTTFLTTTTFFWYDFKLSEESLLVTPALAFTLAISASIFSFVLRLLTKNSDPFIVQASNDANTYLLNSIIWIIACFVFCIFVLFTTCAITFSGQNFMFLTIASVFLLDGIAIAYTINAIIAMMFALRGQIFKSPLAFLSISS
jgi:uncharacterized Tic20 family protein